jgi:hypothetical protein
MSASPTTIWQVPAYLPYLQPPLTDEAVAEAERKIGHRLPEAYLALLRVQNGGYIRYGLPESVHEVIAGIGPHYPSLTDFDWEGVGECISFELDGLVPFDGDGHWHMCLDYRGGRSVPAVTHADIECDAETLVAETFEGYLALLRVQAEESEFVLPDVTDFDRTLRDLSSRLRVKFEAPDSNAHGYPTRRARGGFFSSEWMWISPNVVPRGFARADEDRYAELKDLLPGEALRYPELPPSSYLLNVTDGLRPKVLQACADLGITIRPLAEYVGGAGEGE